MIMIEFQNQLFISYIGHASIKLLSILDMFYYLARLVRASLSEPHTFVLLGKILCSYIYIYIYIIILVNVQRWSERMRPHDVASEHKVVHVQYFF